MTKDNLELKPDELENILATFLAKQRNLEWRINQKHRKDEATRIKLISETSMQNLESAKDKISTLYIKKSLVETALGEDEPEDQLFHMTATNDVRNELRAEIRQKLGLGKE